MAQMAMDAQNNKDNLGKPINEPEDDTSKTESPIEGTTSRRPLPSVLPGSFTLDSSPIKSLDGSKIGSGMLDSTDKPSDVTDKSMFANIPENQVVRNFNEGPPSLSDRPIDLTKRNVVTTNIQDPSDIKPFTKAAIEDKEKRRRDVETARLQAIADARKDEREKNQAKAKQETKKETFQQKLSRRGGFKEGGIASKKPKKKKVMKRGGLASKK